MLSLLKYTLLTLCASAIVMCGFALVSGQTHAANDLLETAFKQARSNDYIVKVGNSDSSRYAGREALVGWNNKESLLVRIAKRLLQLTIAIGIPMLIYGGIRYIIAAGDEGAQKTARTLMINVVIGIVLALSSLAIIQLALSLFNDEKLGQTFEQTASQAPAGLPDTINPNDWQPGAGDTTIATKQGTQTDKGGTTNNIDIQSNPTKNQGETIQ